MSRLYPIVDLDAISRANLEPLAFSERVVYAQPPVLQLRAKRTPARVTLDIARGLSALCKRFDVRFFVNDRPDLAVLAGADGVHVGQEDLSVSEVRAVAPSLQVGVSTHNIEQLTRALAERPSYVAFGPVFPTGSKENPDPVVGLGALERARELADAAGIRLVAIGGIDLERARLLSKLDVDAAVISALVAPSLAEVERRAAELDHVLAFGQ
ncbi:MAG TPA: thiamine phosphate synthase [Polyangiaceae bacterium]|nr:thiamine phosphate synthase [Polyangiaceae bacterium]